MKSILYDYLTCLNVPHTRRGSRAVYESNPYKNSMYGMAEMLREYGIPVKAQRFDTSDSEREPLPVPSIVVYKKQFSILRGVSDGKVNLQVNGRHVTMDYHDFTDGWDGVLLKGTPDAASREPEYRDNHEDEIASHAKALLFILGIAFLAVAIVTGKGFMLSGWELGTLMVNLAGIYVSYLLVLKQMHIANPVAERLCSIIKESRCDSPKLTEHSTVLRMVTLSEIGAGFFVVNTLILLLFPDLIMPMAVLSAIGLLFTFWSLYYQKFVAKTWCTLCLIVLSLMWLQVITLLMAGVYREGGLFSIHILTVFVLYGVFIIAISYLLDYVRSERKYHDEADAYNELRTKPEVMKMLINAEPDYDSDSELQSGMVFGKVKGGRPKLTVFANPYCIPCSRLHKKLNVFYASHPDATIRYTMTFFSEEKSVINRYLIAAYQKFGPERAWQILTDWYDHGRQQGEAFFTGMDLDVNTDEVNAEFDKQLKWRKASGLTATPVMMINGHKLPDEYTADDLEFLAD